jgi:hypothetical protein
MSIGATTASTGAFTTISASNRFTTTFQSTTADGGGSIYLSNATNARIDFVASGVAAPAFTTRSVGTKIVLYPQVGASAVDYAIGIESGTMWSSVATTAQQFLWYGGTTVAMTLSGAGALSATSFAGAHNGTVGATTANTGAFTTLSASSTVSGTGFSTYLASPPAIGGTAAAAITGTTVKASGSSAAIGYATGASAGGTITQGTSRTTGVTLNKITGQITLFATAGSTSAWTAFAVSNSTVTATDTIVVNVASGTNTYIAVVAGVRAGAFDIAFISLNGIASDSPVFNFAVIKGSAN